MQHDTEETGGWSTHRAQRLTRGYAVTTDPRMSGLQTAGLPRTSLTLGLAVAVVVGTASCRQATTETATTEAAAVQETEAWRTTHEADYRREWATIEGLHFLEPGSSTAGSASSNDLVLTPAVPSTIGRFVLANDRVTFEPTPDVPVMINGSPAAGPTVLRDDGQSPTDEVVVDGVSLVIHQSGVRRSLRVRDPNGERARGFLGFRWFRSTRPSA